MIKYTKKEIIEKLERIKKEICFIENNIEYITDLLEKKQSDFLEFQKKNIIFFNKNAVKSFKKDIKEYKRRIKSEKRTLFAHCFYLKHYKFFIKKEQKEAEKGIKIYEKKK